jgi:hypothetical protein
LISLGVFIFFALSAFLAGDLVLKLARVEPEQGLERIISPFAVGLFAITLLTTLLGVFHLLYPPVFWFAFLAIDAAWLLVRARVTGGSAPGPRIRELVDLGPVGWALFGLLSLLITATLIFANLPPLGIDPLVYHLTIPKVYLSEHAIVPMPENIYSNFPLNVEMLFLAGMALGGDRVCVLIASLAGLLSVLLVMALVDRRRITTAGLAAALIYFVHADVVMQNTAALVDQYFAFFSVLGVYYLVRFAESGKASHAWLGAMAAGYSVGIKLTGGATYALTLALFAWYYGRRRNAREILKPILLSCAGFAPWLLKNLIFSGNPFWPFLSGVFGDRLFNPATVRSFIDGINSYVDFPRDMSGYVSLPLVLTHEPWMLFSNYISPLFLSLMPFILVSKFRDLGFRILLSFILIYSLVWFESSPLSRFLLPVFIILSAWCAVQAREVLEPGRRFFGFMVVVLAGCWIAYGSWWTIRSQAWKLDRVLGRQSEEAFSRISFAKESEMTWQDGIKHLNGMLSEGDRVLFLDTRAYHLNTRPVPAVEFLHASADERTMGEVVKFLRSSEVRYIFLIKNTRLNTWLNLSAAGLTRIIYNCPSDDCVIFEVDRRLVSSPAAEDIIRSFESGSIQERVRRFKEDYKRNRQ